ncbi:MAG TPA: hypothetical protein VER14_02910 [Phototrophicaceae bacterium]|nr:hypothetical protein [Phototrophicaceae bacterium]
MAPHNIGQQIKQYIKFANVNDSGRHHLLVVLYGISLLTLIHSPIPLDTDIALGQEKSVSNDRQLNVDFNSMKINNDHDPLFPGEWKIDSYVNDQRIPLWTGSGLDRVNTGQTVTFSGKDANVTIPSNGTLRIVTVGVEFDIDHQDNLPNISGILDKDLPISDYSDEAESSTNHLIVFDRNDAIGIVSKEYSAEVNFGIGQHDECSQSVGEAGDLYDEVDTSCDFRLRYTITENNTTD